jgi:HEAT repeat protein
MVVNRDSSHPVTAGLPEKWMHARDELYSLLRGAGENMHILATAYSDPGTRGTGRDEPVLFTITFGKGRIFHTVLGHAMGDGPHPAMQCVGFIVTFLRGAEWAATGKVTQKIPGDFPVVNREKGTPDDIRLWPDYTPPDLKQILDELAGHDYGKDEEILSRLRDYVQAHRNFPESKKDSEAALLDFLVSGASLAAKQAACRQLREIGSAASVAVLGKMLLQPETSDMARYALEKIPGGEADSALVEGLTRADGKIRFGIIDSLGNRKALNSVSSLARVLSSPDKRAAIASARALGKIASQEACAVLFDAISQTSGALKEQIASSLLRCAEIQMAENESSRAAEIYHKLIKTECSLPTWQAAIRGQIASSGDKAKEMIIEALSDKNVEWHAPAIAMVKDVFDASSIQEVLMLLPNLPAESQVQLIQVLSHYREKGVRDALILAVKNKDPSVRIEALQALQTAGNYTAVELLASHAALSSGEEQLAARTSLWGLKCGHADPTILTDLVKIRDEAIQHELILAVGERRIKQGKNLLLSRAQYGSDRNRLQAIRGLENIASPDVLPSLVKLMLGLNKETDQLEMASTIASVASRVSQGDKRVEAVRDELEMATDVKDRCALYRTLGKIGDDSSLQLLRTALADENMDVQDAAVRAIAEWPSASANEDLLQIAKTSQTPVHKVIALQAYIRMIGMESYRSPQNAVQLFKDVLYLARPEEKKLILGILPTFASADALALAQMLFQEKGVEAEAEMAIQMIREKLEKDGEELSFEKSTFLD